MRILLVEDEPDLGAAIRRSLTQEAYVVDWVQNGDEAQGLLNSHWAEYTLAIFDWMVPGHSGLELCKSLRAQKSALPVLMLTAKDSLADKVAGLDAGADDYLVKPFGMEELLARMRALQRRSPQLQPTQLQVGPFTLDYGTQNVFCQTSTQAPQQVFLTLKEFQVLEYFMRHPNQIITRDRILQQLWEVGADPTSNVVAAQIRLLRRKLEPWGHHNTIETVYGAGYRFTATNRSDAH